MVQTDIRALSQSEITDFFIQKKQLSFRGEQVYGWLWKESVHSFDKMTNLSKDLREELKRHFVIRAVSLHSSQKSEDDTIKNIFKLYDGQLVEGVLINSKTRKTACVSSQVGCSLSCKFCATGYMKLKRNLNADEIYDQVVLLNRQSMNDFGENLSNIVYMGMGEPLLNYKEVMRSIDRITAADGLNIAAKRITVSTAGIAKMITKLGDDGAKFNLALSLHAANDVKRAEIMPINKTNSLASLLEALKHYYTRTGKLITLEYIVFEGFNDSLNDAAELLKFCKQIQCKVNIIEYNPISQADFKQTSKENLDIFTNHLRKNQIITNIRHSRGKDIDAACGQLALKTAEKIPTI